MANTLKEKIVNTLNAKMGITNPSATSTMTTRAKNFADGVAKYTPGKVASNTNSTKKTYSYTTNANNQPYVDQLNALYGEIMGRGPFKYDLNGDMLYRQMADQYTQLGRQAMMDTMGQASALTGGYGNSFAQSVGNQAYQQYLTALNEQVPNLYGQALNAYLAEGERMLQMYQLAAEHPGIINALSPKTHTYTVEEEDDGKGDSSHWSDLFDAARMNFLTAQTTASANPLDGWYYQLLNGGK